MKATITFEKEIEKIPESCAKCPFVEICDEVLHGITKSGGMQFTKAATQRRIKGCPLKVSE